MKPRNRHICSSEVDAASCEFEGLSVGQLTQDT
jgi:hypothetical protein